MLTLFGYLPSRNAWKVRLLLHHLGQTYRTILVDILEGEGQRMDYLQINPTGKVPAIQLDDGRTLAESNAILMYLSEGTPYLPADSFDRAKVLQWLSFEQEQVESTIGTLRYWTRTGELSRHTPELVESMQRKAQRALRILDDLLVTQSFVIDDRYTIADMAVFAYATCAEDVGIPLEPYPHFRAWIARVKAQPGFLGAPE